MRALQGLRVCRFGRYDATYSRNRILDKCLRREGATIVEIADEGPLLARGPRLLARARRARFDLVLVGFRAHSDMVLARLIARARRVPLIFDPLISRYDEKVVDRQLVGRRSPLAGWYYLTDKLGCALADLVLLDTDAQIAYFADTFGLPRSKFRRVWIGSDDEVMYPRPVAARGGELRVFFYGRFGPLHGVEYIIEAAKELERRGEHVRFVLVGAGQTYDAARVLAERIETRSVEFVDPVPYERLPLLMADADLCLGIFGTTAKARRVIPNKVFDALAMGRPVVTADTPAVREALTHGENVWLCPCEDSQALADAIAFLKCHPDLRAALAVQGHDFFQRHFSLAAITQDLVPIVSGLVHGMAHSAS